MKPEDKALRIGTAVILCAILLRLFAGNLPGRVLEFLSRPQVASAMVFMQTGRVIRFSEPTSPAVTEPETEPVSRIPITFQPEDAALVQIANASGCAVDVEALLATPLDWDLSQQAPTVLILHTHTTESYADSCEKGSGYRSTDETKNMLAIGDRVAQQLTDAGIGVIHDRQVHDYPSYNGAYNHSRSQAVKYLAEYPSIQLVLDLHRDAITDSSGKQMNTGVMLDGADTAQLMLVVGTNAGGLQHPQWKQNMALAVKLQVLLAKVHPQLVRTISLRSQRFNQDLSPGALLVEVGTAGNSMDQALCAADRLAEAIIALSSGA